MESPLPLARKLVWIGLILAAVGLLLHALPSLPWLGRLPGDLRIERPGWQIHLPITTSLLLSILLSALLWLFSRLR
jgi:hypothetical protein